MAPATASSACSAQAMVAGFSGKQSINRILRVLFSQIPISSYSPSFSQVPGVPSLFAFIPSHPSSFFFSLDLFSSRDERPISLELSTQTQVAA